MNLIVNAKDYRRSEIANPDYTSSIFLTTATDVVSMGAMLALATLLI